MPVDRYMLMRDEEGKKKEAPKAVTFPKKNELPWVGFEPMILCTLDRPAELSWLGSILHLIVHLMNRLTINTCIFTDIKKMTNC